MLNRKLSLKRESLAELSTTDLVSVAGAQQALLTHATCGTCGVTDACTHGPSLDYCPTVPVNDCLSVVAVKTLNCATT